MCQDIRKEARIRNMAMKKMFEKFGSLSRATKYLGVNHSWFSAFEARRKGVDHLPPKRILEKTKELGVTEEDWKTQIDECVKVKKGGNMRETSIERLEIPYRYKRLKPKLRVKKSLMCAITIIF